MGLIRTYGRNAWRKYVVDGVSASGFHEPELGAGGDIFAFVDAVDAVFHDAISGIEAIKNDDYTILATEGGTSFVANKASAIAFDLPAAASVVSEAGDVFQVRVMNIGAGLATIDPDGSETINGASTLVLAQFDSATIWTDGTTWRADTNKVPGVGTINIYDIARDGVAFTHSGGQASYTFKSGDVDPDAWYDDIYPSVSNYDALRGVTQIEAGSDIVHATAVAGYVRNAQGVTGAGPNGVALFGLAIAAVDDAAVWGINTLLQDSDVRAAGTDTGRILVNELDFNVMNPDTQVIGLSIGGNSLAQPTEASGFVVNPLGNGNKWTTGFFTQDGAAGNGFAIGASAASGMNINGQNMLFSFFDGGGTKRNILQRAEGTFLVYSQTTGTFGGIKISAGNLLLDSGQGVIVNGNTVLTDRGAAVADAAGGTEITTINAILARLRSHGLIAT